MKKSDKKIVYAFMKNLIKRSKAGEIEITEAKMEAPEYSDLLSSGFKYRMFILSYIDSPPKKGRKKK